MCCESHIKTTVIYFQKSLTMSYYGDSSSEEEEEESNFFKGRDTFIYVIDALMYKKVEDFYEALTLIRESFLTGVSQYCLFL